MVFEVSLADIRADIIAGNYAAAKTKLLTLIDNVEARYLTLGPAQKARWEDTRKELPHIRDHIDSIIRLFEQRQREKILQIIDTRITEI